MITKEDIFDSISTVMDPEVGFNLVELGLIYSVEIDESNFVNVIMTLSTRGCPLHQSMIEWVKDAVKKVEGVSGCSVDVVWDPAWNITMASEHVRQALKY